IPMPQFIGLNRASAEEQLKLQNFKDYQFVEEEDDNAPPGQVIRQEPLANSQIVPKETSVRLIVSKGKKYVKMPNVVGDSIDKAKLELLKAGLAEGPINREPSYTVTEPDVVISTHPYDANMDVVAGQQIPLTVSNGEYPADAKVGTYAVPVELFEGETAEIKIVVDDARGNQQIAFQETIQASTEYKVPIVLSPNKNGTIEVLKNNATFAKYVIEYRNFP
ncbi:PASTA domain-containing protein, partial [Brevibacillus sp. SYSU BS000544]|uniref:PASTA domain-containing protein n=1 Tax=Brevibacillus sp. SYSU BS000544 TaxID=3416443 RepID=UPI003CE56E64